MAISWNRAAFIVLLTSLLPALSVAAGDGNAAPASRSGVGLKFTSVGGEFQANSFSGSDQRFADVALKDNGDFVLVWHSDGSNGSDSSSFSIQGQRFASDGTTVGGEFQVNSYTSMEQRYPAVALDSGGGFVVVWASRGSGGGDSSLFSIQGQRFASDGTVVASEFQVNSYTVMEQRFADVEFDTGDGFVVVWQSRGSNGDDSSSYSIQGQRYASDGTTLGGEFQINSYTSASQNLPSVVLQSNDDFVVVWNSFGSSGSDSDGYGIQGQRFASDGTVVGDEFQINSYTTSNQHFTALSSDSNDGFVVVWNSNGSSGSDSSLYSIRGQRFASGAAVGSEFQVNSFTGSNQRFADVAMKPDGRFVVVWSSSGSSGNDSSGDSIQSQRFAADGTPVGDEFQVNSYTTSNQGFASVAMNPKGDFVMAWESDGSSGSDSSANSIQVQRFTLEVDLSISKDDGVTSAIPGQTVTYTIVALNNGPDSMSPVTVGDTFPAELTCTWTSVEAGGATGNSASSGNLADTLDMPTGSSVTYTVICTIDPAATGTLSNTATISSPAHDPMPGDESATDNDTLLVPTTDLSLAKSAPVEAITGSIATYTFNVTNDGPSTSTGGSVVDTLPLGLSFSSSSDCLEAAGTVTCAFGALAPGADVSLSFDALVDGSLADATLIVNTATVSANEADPNALNDSDSETLTASVPIFTDGFESGNTNLWSNTVP